MPKKKLNPLCVDSANLQNLNLLTPKYGSQTPMPQLYTTAEAAKETGIPKSTIGSWMRLQTGVFFVDVHFVVSDSGQKLWTEAGIELLKSRRSAAQENALNDEAETSTDNFLELLLDTDSRQIAKEYWRQLPARVLHRIKQMRDNPTPEERQLVQLSLSTAVRAGTSHLLLPSYEPMLSEGEDSETD